MELKAYLLKENVGHGNARRASISLCNENIVALMDSDDICLPTRFEKQIPLLCEGEFSVVGGQISEFDDNPNAVYSYRNVELSHEQIVSDLKKRCPFNQMTVAFKKDDYSKSGGYLDWFCNEDYYLWARMFMNGLSFANVPDILVNVRANKSQVSRRRGKKYFKSEKDFQKYLLKNKIIKRPRYFINVFKRFIGEMIIGYLFPSLFIRLAHSKKNKYNKIYSSTVIHTTDCPFSVAMCVYAGDKPEWFEDALVSVLNQTLKPKEIILVVDGPVPEPLFNIIKKYFEVNDYER